MMLAGRYRDQDPTGWWGSEKLDGCRAFWDGACLRTRTWRPIDAPAWMTEHLPKDRSLDGELWAGRGNFQLARVLVQHGTAGDPRWRQMRYCVFDAPTTDAVPVEARLEEAQKMARGQGVEFLAQRRLSTAGELHRWFADVVRQGGEGLCLRRPGSFYVFGRSCDWLKVKPAGVD